MAPSPRAGNYTYVIDGELYHEDSTGGRGVIHAREVQRMFSGDYIEHQELNLTEYPTRVIQIWFVADMDHMGLPPHYEQVALTDMPARHNGDGVVRDIIGPQGATDSHVTARLTSTVIPAGGQTTLESPEWRRPVSRRERQRLMPVKRRAGLGLYDTSCWQHLMRRLTDGKR
ncbi:MAG: pirin family protein [Chloroflexota bacterium]